MSVLVPSSGSKKVIHPTDAPDRIVQTSRDAGAKNRLQRGVHVIRNSLLPLDDMRVMERQRAHLTISRENTVPGPLDIDPPEQRGGNAVEGQDMVGCTTLDRDARHAVDDACLFVFARS